MNASACPPALMASTSQVTASSFALRRASESLPSGDGIPKREVFAAARRAVVVDHFDIAADEARGELARVGDRGAGGEKYRTRTIVFAHAHQVGGARPTRAPPIMPRYVWTSSTTTYRSSEKNAAHFG